jgi:membrane-bound serine protease (ClpP class)
MDPTYLTMGLVLIGLGFVLLVAELFLPTSGTLLVLSFLSMAAGVALIFVYDTNTGIYTIIVLFIALPIFGGFILYFWPKTPMGKRFFLTRPDADATLAAMPINKELEQLRGRFGRALSALRPSGVVDFEGRRVDTVTEGMMVEPGQWVRCVEVQANRVVVRPVDKPNLDTLENADFS